MKNNDLWDRDWQDMLPKSFSDDASVVVLDDEKICAIMRHRDRVRARDRRDHRGRVATIVVCACLVFMMVWYARSADSHMNRQYEKSQVSTTTQGLDMP